MLKLMLCLTIFTENIYHIYEIKSLDHKGVKHFLCTVFWLVRFASAQFSCCGSSSQNCCLRDNIASEGDFQALQCKHAVPPKQSALRTAQNAQFGPTPDDVTNSSISRQNGPAWHHVAGRLTVRVEWFTTFCDFRKGTYFCRSSLFLWIQFQKKLANFAAHEPKLSFWKITGPLKMIFFENLWGHTYYFRP